MHEQLIQFYRGFRHDAHPMAIMCGVVGALAAFYPEVRPTLLALGGRSLKALNCFSTAAVLGR